MKNFSILDLMDVARALGDKPEKATPYNVYLFLKDNYLKPSGGGFNYSTAIEALQLGLSGKYNFEDAIRHVNSKGVTFGQKYNEAVVRAIWPVVDAHFGKAYPLKYTAVPLRRVGGKSIFLGIKSPVMTVTSEKDISIKLPNFRNTFGPNYDQKRFMLSVTKQVLARDDFGDATVDLVQARSTDGNLERELSLLSSEDVDLIDIDRVEDLLTIYTEGVEMLMQNGFQTKDADLSRYRVIDPDAPDLFK